MILILCLSHAFSFKLKEPLFLKQSVSHAVCLPVTWQKVIPLYIGHDCAEKHIVCCYVTGSFHTWLEPVTGEKQPQKPILQLAVLL